MWKVKRGYTGFDKIRIAWTSAAARIKSDNTFKHLVNLHEKKISKAKVHIIVFFSLGRKENQNFQPKQAVLKFSYMILKPSSPIARDACTSMPKKHRLVGRNASWTVRGAQLACASRLNKQLLTRLVQRIQGMLLTAPEKSVRQIHMQGWVFFGICPTPHPIQHSKNCQTLQLFSLYICMYKHMHINLLSSCNKAVKQNLSHYCNFSVSLEDLKWHV